MRYNRLGRSGLVVSSVCLGGNSWGAAGLRQWGAFDEAERRVFFQQALDSGINYFDTADTYNAGESERIMGATLLKMARREDVVISSKVGIPLSKKPNDGGLGRKHLMASIDACLQRLGTDYVDIYHIHRLDGVTPLEETLDAFTDMVRMGKVRYLGGSTMPAYRFAQIHQLVVSQGPAVALTANRSRGLAGEGRAHDNCLDASGFDQPGKLVVDLSVAIDQLGAV